MRDCDMPTTRMRVERRVIGGSRKVHRWALAVMRPTAPWLGIAGGFYGAAIWAEDQNWPSRLWKHGAAHTATDVLGIVAFAGGGLLVYGFARAEGKRKLRDDLTDACVGMWALAVEELGLPMEKVGVCVFSVAGPPKLRFLEQRAGFVVGQRTRSHVLWRRGKGAVGIAWANDAPMIANVEHLEGRLGRLSGGATRTELARAFCSIPYEERFGLGFREFFRTRQYRAVLAVPLRKDGDSDSRVIGCLSIDLLVDGKADELAALIHHDDFDNVVAVCEGLLAQ